MPLPTYVLDGRLCMAVDVDELVKSLKESPVINGF